MEGDKELFSSPVEVLVYAHSRVTNEKIERGGEHRRRKERAQKGIEKKSDLTHSD